MQRFDSKALFEEALINGINLFCGAGFSVESSADVKGKLPLGFELLQELKKEFGTIDSYSDLSRAATKLKATDEASFNDFLKKRFTVSSYNPLYNELLKIKLKKIYTTNIDDLFYKIFTQNKSSTILLDRTEGNEPALNEVVDYFPLHGYIRHSKPTYLFTAVEVATAFEARNKATWTQLGQDASQSPMLFWGWNFQDAAPIQAMFGNQNNTKENINKWFLLHSDGQQPSEEDIDFLETLGFNIIIGNTLNLLEYFKEFALEKEEFVHSTAEPVHDLLQVYTPPSQKNLKKYFPISDYYINYAPEWSHIYGDNIHKLGYFKEIIDKIADKKNIAIFGIPCSGKTTLLMQLATYFTTSSKNRTVHFMSSPSKAEVDRYITLIDNLSILLFVDDCFRDTNAVTTLLSHKNIQLVFADRERNFENQVYKLPKEAFIPIDITDITQIDAQGIINKIPTQLKKTKASTRYHEKDPTIINLLATVLKRQDFKFILATIEKDEVVGHIIILICYVHSCGTPCSFDMIYSFLDDTK